MTAQELLLITNAALAINGGSWHPATHTEPWNPLAQQHQADALLSALKMQVMELDGTTTVLGCGYARSAKSKEASDVRRLVVEVAAAIGANLKQLREDRAPKVQMKPSER